MEQKKIGQFISELRKEQEMTQQQLADSLGVSNKTISKWECGNGMPDISSIIPLCEILNITVNELISGERLTPDNYSQKAEENMLHFIKQEEDRSRKLNPLALLLITFSILFLCWFTIFSAYGNSLWSRFFDFTTLFSMSAITFLVLICLKLTHAFFHAFIILFGKREPTTDELILSHTAVKLVRTLWLTTGLFISSILYSGMYPRTTDDLLLLLEALYYTFPLAISGLLYGFMGYFLLLPVQTKLDILLKKHLI